MGATVVESDSSTCISMGFFLFILKTCQKGFLFFLFFFLLLKQNNLNRKDNYYCVLTRGVCVCPRALLASIVSGVVCFARRPLVEPVGPR